MSDHVEQVIAQGDDRPREPAGELLERRVELRGVWRVDHAEHRLGPCQVDSPERNARSVNSPGSAGRAPRARQ